MTEFPDQPLRYYAPETVPYAGIRAWVRAFGVIALILGCLSACMALAGPFLLLFVGRHGRPSALRPGTVVAGSLVYLEMASAGIAFGLGAIHLRRWVRPMGMIGGVIGILGGCSLVVLTGFLLATNEAEMRSRRGAGQVGGVLFLMLFLIVVVVGIIVPGLFFWFFRKPEVRGMLEHYDPNSRWTDRYPVPVLALAVALVAFAADDLASVPLALAPMFGRVFIGLPAMGIQLAKCAIILSLAPLVLRRRPGGWWGSLVLGIILAVAYGATLLRPDRIDMYRRAGYSQSQLDAMETRGVAGELAGVLPQMLVSFGYLIYARRYFLIAEPD